MTAKTRLGDRREHTRFDVTGQLWAALDLSAPVVVRNIGVGGALVEARLTPGLRSLRGAQISIHEQGPPLTVVVRHLSPLSDAAGEDCYLVGLEFMHLSAAAQSEVEAVVREWNGQVAI
jgi:hypothetical protein